MRSGAKNLIAIAVLGAACVPSTRAAAHTGRAGTAISKDRLGPRGCLKEEDGISTNAMNLSVADARRNLVAALERMNRDGYGLKSVEPIQHVRVLPQMFEFLDSGVAEEGGPYSLMRYFPFQRLDHACILKSRFNGYALQVAVDNTPAYTTGQRLLLFGYRGFQSRPTEADWANARMLVDSVNRLIVEYNKGNPTDAANWADFKIKAAAWRALAQKPPFPEEAHKYRILAEEALERKSFDESLKYYETALDAFPFWPEGYFNAGMICAEIGDYTNGLRHMQHYLELAPEAPDARAALDKSYIWEEKAKEVDAQLQHGDDSSQASAAHAKANGAALAKRK